MTVPTISPAELAGLLKTKSARLLDVRSPAEYREVHAEGAESLPLDRLDPAAVMAGHAEPAIEPVYVICKSGSRGRQAAERFHAAGYTAVANVEGGTLAWERAGLPVARGRRAVSVERQVRIAAGSLVFASVVLGASVSPWFLILGGFIGGGLVFSGVTDTCGMGNVLALMPWNR